jgi:hypothetical protein
VLSVDAEEQLGPDDTGVVHEPTFEDLLGKARQANVPI